MKLTSKTLTIISLSFFVVGMVVLLTYKSMDVEPAGHQTIRMIGYILMWTGLIVSVLAYWKRNPGGKV